MDPNYGGDLDEQNWQSFCEGIESLSQQPQIPVSRDPFDSLSGSHFQSVDLGSQSVAGTELLDTPQVFPQVPIAGDDRYLSEFFDPAGTNQDNQVIAGRLQPDLPQGFDYIEKGFEGSFAHYYLSNWSNVISWEELSNQALRGTEQPHALAENPFRLSPLPNWRRLSPERIEALNRGQPSGSQAATRGQDQLARKRKRAMRQKIEAENEQLKASADGVPLWEWIFVVSNLTVELPSAVFDQLSSPHKPLYALMAMAFSLLALVLCVIGLVYKGVKERITFKRPRDKIPWFCYPSRSQNHKRFGTFADLIGLVSAISQCIVTAVNYDFARRAANGSIKFSLLPIIFALALLCSRILQTVEKKASESSDL